MQQELRAARRALETQATQILSLEAALLGRGAGVQEPESEPAPEPDSGEDASAPQPAAQDDVVRVWEGRLAAERAQREEAERSVAELARQLECERKVRTELGNIYDSGVNCCVCRRELR